MIGLRIESGNLAVVINCNAQLQDFVEQHYFYLVSGNVVILASSLKAFELLYEDKSVFDLDAEGVAFIFGWDSKNRELIALSEEALSLYLTCINDKHEAHRRPEILNSALHFLRLLVPGNQGH